jgi:hypothetical protein
MPGFSRKKARTIQRHCPFLEPLESRVFLSAVPRAESFGKTARFTFAPALHF